ncbi:PAS domain-containing protein [Kineosporia babensis]|uniref:PAS domain-containing protein n=1 Tax=Kineosporia babensis TaxID=499548 RepID=A0A9X1N975_9ACTN|nr:histidine kinase N-terminal 7TM domain-containing protein [Kineosporia babensis]MCD5309495.1 PAS domain-containing protein [Kineosporia babensis]
MSTSAWLVCALVAGGVGYLALAGFVWANRQGVGSRPLVVMLLAVKVWSVCYALELSSTDLEVAQFWSALKYFGVVALPPALWSFVFAYTGRGRMSRRSVALLAIHPVLVMTLLLIPGTRGLIQDYTETDQILNAQTPTAGPLFWPHAAYVYALMLGADFVLMARLARIAPPYRRQGALLIAASVLPCFGNLLWNSALAETGMVDPTPFLFGITAVVLVWGFFRLRLLDLTPVARGIVIEQMADGVLVLDVYGRVVDVNAAAASIISYPRRAMIGRYVVDVVPPLASVLEKQEVGTAVDTVEDEVLIYPLPEGEPVDEVLTGFWGGLFTRPELELPQKKPQPGRMRVAELERPYADLRSRRMDPSGLSGPTGQDRFREHSGEQLVLGPPRDVAVSMTWVTDPVGRRIARLVVLRDVTERNRTEKKLRELLNEQTRLSETLSQSLRPAHLPQLPGLRFAARSVPSARGGGVGGDFYDVHTAGSSGESAFVLGDVAGKGCTRPWSPRWRATPCVLSAPRAGLRARCCASSTAPCRPRTTWNASAPWSTAWSATRARTVRGPGGFGSRSPWAVTRRRCCAAATVRCTRSGARAPRWACGRTSRFTKWWWNSNQGTSCSPTRTGSPRRGPGKNSSGRSGWPRCWRPRRRGSAQAGNRAQASPGRIPTGRR